MTIQDSLDHQRIRRVLHVGRALVEGPRALFPPAALDDFGWLEPYLRIELSSSGLEVSRSIAIYTDSTMNRDDNFSLPSSGMQSGSKDKTGTMHRYGPASTSRSVISKSKDKKWRDLSLPFRRSFNASLSCRRGFPPINAHRT